MMHRWIALAAAASASVAPGLPASAQTPPELKLDAREPYRHKPSGLAVPVTLDGLPRTGGRAFAPDQLDESIAFGTPGDTESLTVYVFRHVTGSVPVWFDRAAWAAEHRDIYGGLVATRPAYAFTPPGQATATGLAATYRPGKGPYRSTAVAMMPLGADWYVALRYSSQTLDPATLDTRLKGVVTALGWPGKITAQPAAAPVADCTAPLALSGPARARASDKSSGTSALMSALLASAVAGERKETDGDPSRPPPLWCRDTGRYAGLGASGVYRPVGTTDQYLIALGDGGRGAFAGPDAVAVLLGKEAVPGWSLGFVDMATTASYAPRDRLPPPDQLLQILKSEPYSSRAATWGDKRNVEINSSALK